MLAGVHIKYRLSRREGAEPVGTQVGGEMKDRMCLWLAYRLPRTLVKWASIRLVASATAGEHSSQIVPELTAIEALRRWQA